MADFERDVLALLPRLRRFALSLSRDALEAEDLVQDSLERAFAARAQWQGTNLRAWLTSIVVNRFRNDRRRSRLRPAFVDVDGDAPVLADPATADPLRRAQLRQAIGRLDPDQRAVLMLVVVEGYRYREVADLLGVPVGTVMSRLSRARGALGEMLKGENIVELRRGR